jgi:hypothetical protein
MDCITRAIESKFGEGVRQVIYWKFQEVTKLEVSDIPKKPQIFIDTIRLVFGTGSVSIERTITERICHEFKISLTGEPSFTRALQLAKSKQLKEDLTEN